MDNNSFEILKTFHAQFSESQSVRKSLFIQFLTAVFVVIFGYVIVYVRINIDAKLIDIRVGDSGEILSYAIIHLILAFLITQIILILLSSLILNTGYEFRRDQKIVYQIRRMTIEDRFYFKIFGENTFSPYEKSKWTYLPGFHFIFATVIYVIQIIISVSFLVMMLILDNWFSNAGGLFLAIIIGVSPIVYSIRYYYYYYKKYQRTMNDEVRL